MSRELETASDLPPFVAIPDTVQSPGYLGIKYSALKTSGTPQADKPFSCARNRNGGGVTIPDVERRQNLLKDLDTTFASIEKQSDLLSGLDEFSQKAHQFITSERLESIRYAQEKSEVRAEFGKSNFGQSCLLAVRLVEAGVRFVTVGMGGWDTHADNFNRLKTKTCRNWTRDWLGCSTPWKVSDCCEYTGDGDGRIRSHPQDQCESGPDHWPRAMFVLMGGGGVAGGRILGASDENGMGPKRSEDFS